MSEKIDWDKVEAMADAMTDADIGLVRRQKMYTPEEGRKVYLQFRKDARKSPGYKETFRRVQAQQKAACALRLMREHANISQAEVARRMAVRAPAVSRLERLGVTTLRSLTEYARACGYTISIVAKGHSEQLAMA